MLRRLRYVRAWLAWVRSIREPEPSGLEALFTFDGVPERADPLLDVSSLDPAEVGRDRKPNNIDDVAYWLAVSGFADWAWDKRRSYALWLLERRFAYEGGRYSEVRS